MAESFPKNLPVVPGTPFYESNLLDSTPGLEQDVLVFSVLPTKNRKLSQLFVVSRFWSVWRVLVNAEEIARVETGPGKPTAIRIWNPLKTIESGDTVEVKARVFDGFPVTQIRADLEGGEVNV